MVDPKAPVAVARKVQRRSSALSVAATKRGLITVGLGFLLLGLGFLALGVFIELGQEPHQSLLSAQAAKLNSIPAKPAVPATSGAATPRYAGGSTATTASPSPSTLKPTATATATPTRSAGPRPTGHSRPSGGPTASSPVAPSDVDLALGRPVNSTSHAQNYLAANVTDGSTGSYWEGDSGFPQTLTVDLGAVSPVQRLGLTLPTCCNWDSRTQTIAVYASLDGVNFAPVLAPTGYTFDADGSGRDSVSVSLPSTPARFVQLQFSANSGWPAAQLSELQVFSS